MNIYVASQSIKQSLGETSGFSENITLQSNWQIFIMYYVEEDKDFLLF